jgi:hypothetical protein
VASVCRMYEELEGIVEGVGGIWEGVKVLRCFKI